MPQLYAPLHRSSIQQRWIRCKKANCAKCPHGPYLYRVWRDGNRIRAEYVGKVPPIALTGGGVEHPFKIGDGVRFRAESQPYWLLVEGTRQRVFDTRPTMKIEAIGWAPMGRTRDVHPYAMLVTQEGVRVHHPYDPTFSSADLAGRLDRRFPAALLERA